MGDALLEVTVTHARDVVGAQEGGCDRLHVIGDGQPAEALSPEPALVSSICRESEVPVFVLLRLNDSWTTTGGEMTRLVGLAEDYLGCGAQGVSFGFLDPDLEVDSAVCSYVAASLPNVPWTFHRAVDATLDPRRTWRRLLRFPGLVAVRSAGSPQGMAVGYEDLLATAQSDPAIARVLMPGGGLNAEHVPWLVRAGVRQFHLGSQVRPGASCKSYVDAEHVRSWRLMIDAAVDRAEGMTILIDPPNTAGHGRLWSHLASDESYDELHAFARTLGIPERGFDRDHYDVPSEWYDDVVAAGAEPVRSRELVQRLRDSGLRRRKTGG